VHELSLCQAIAGVVNEHAKGRSVQVVRVRVGALRQVVPDTLTFCWNIVRDQADLADAALELEVVPGVVDCRQCGQRHELTSRWSILCPSCNSCDVAVVGGEEFLVTSLEVT